MWAIIKNQFMRKKKWVAWKNDLKVYDVAI